MRAVNASSPPTGGDVLLLPRDEDELGILAHEPHLDASVGELTVQLDGGLAEGGEQLHRERALDRNRDPAGRLGSLLVTELGDRGEVVSQRFDESRQLHDDSTMTSLVTSVKCHPTVIPPSEGHHRMKSAIPAHIRLDFVTPDPARAAMPRV